VIESSQQIEAEYAKAAGQGSTATGAPTDEVECHYICFTKATPSSLWLLDGDRDGPLSCNQDCGLGVDVLEGPSREIIQRFIEDCNHGISGNLGMMALVRA
jgi:hypothetical protein